MSSPLAYERALAPLIRYNETKALTDPPRDLHCGPYLDHPDANDRRALQELQAAGVPDASKVSKASVQYSKANGPDQCRVCAHWAGPPGELSPCQVVCGLVRQDRWCEKWTKGVVDGQQPLQQPENPPAGGPGENPQGPPQGLTGQPGQ